MKFQKFKDYVEGRMADGDTFIDPNGTGMAGLPQQRRSPATVVTPAPKPMFRSPLGSQYDATPVSDGDTSYDPVAEKEAEAERIRRAKINRPKKPIIW